jgi:hypothetical protein
VQGTPPELEPVVLPELELVELVAALLLVELPELEEELAVAVLEPEVEAVALLVVAELPVLVVELAVLVPWVAPMVEGVPEQAASKIDESNQGKGLFKRSLYQAAERSKVPSPRDLRDCRMSLKLVSARQPISTIFVGKRGEVSQLLGKKS